jgi:hypothetical protein
MARRIGFIWDTPVMFTRLVEDCGYVSELITPHLLAAPFFRRSYSGLIVPSGFAHPSFSQVLPALRACEDRIQRYIRGGGTILVFGAGIDKPDAYDWLFFQVRYYFGFFEGEAELCSHGVLSCITDECPGIVSIDGIFDIPDIDTSSHSSASDNRGCAVPVILMKVRGLPVMMECLLGAGRIILTTLHEYPSRRFLSAFCITQGETLL